MIARDLVFVIPNSIYTMEITLLYKDIQYPQARTATKSLRKTVNRGLFFSEMGVCGKIGLHRCEYNPDKA
jgi:hypothetical protein